MTAVRIARLNPDDLNELAETLSVARLPIADLAEPGRVFFRFEDGTGLVGFAGLEGDGADRLLRSLVVVPDRRGAGLGRAILALLEGEARQLGTHCLHLLTETAEPFFRANGYDGADRYAAPTAVAGSREFTALCPASAAYLVKAL